MGLADGVKAELLFPETLAVFVKRDLSQPATEASTRIVLKLGQLMKDKRHHVLH